MEKAMNNVLSVVLAGGKGSRLDPLTADRSKPAVPFGGAFRIIDFSLSNCINSGLRRILVVTQYKAASLERHIERGWHFLCNELGDFVRVRPPEQRVGESWYLGTADALYQNIYTIEKIAPKHVLILSGDHIYQMNYRRFVSDHIQSEADCSIACVPVPVEEGRRFGVMQVDRDNRIVNFAEKPENPEPLPDKPAQCLASMGIYVFRTEFLFEHLCRDANTPNSHRDFGKDIIPSIIDQHLVRAWSFSDQDTGEPCYWKDVGTLETYYEANMDLISVDPKFNLYDSDWPIRSYQKPLPPPKFVFNDPSPGNKRVGYAVDSMVCPGSIISGGTVERSILGPSVRINSYAEVRDSILYEGVLIGRYARVRRAIIDKNVQIPEGMRIGYDADEDRRHGLTVSENGIVAVPKGARFDTHSNVLKPHIGQREVSAGMLRSRADQ
ncbi:MAG: glucose-1-phosphate adenylyltransferase [Fuerstiella sp.]|jgi:glucose-1-phosphate adenylyltransferase|nr:glucose-1-phosphate adenylyltransferase [Fuerstiella sp.]